MLSNHGVNNKIQIAKEKLFSIFEISINNLFNMQECVIFFLLSFLVI